MSSKEIDYFIPENDIFYNQKLYDFRITKKSLIFSYSSLFGSFINIISHNLFKKYTLSDVYIENLPDDVYLDLMLKFEIDKFITLRDIRGILITHKCKINIPESRIKEWDYLAYRIRISLN